MSRWQQFKAGREIRLRSPRAPKTDRSADFEKHTKRLELVLWQRRLTDLAGAAMDTAAIEDFENSARSAGLADVSSATLAQDGDVLIGWRLTARVPEIA